jgi:hypothetical protein
MGHEVLRIQRHDHRPLSLDSPQKLQFSGLGRFLDHCLGHEKPT